MKQEQEQSLYWDVNRETGWNSDGQIGLVAAVRTFGMSLLDVKVFYDERNQHLGREEGCH